MLTLSRGIEPFWLNDKDAVEIGVEDNDWIEAYNDNGVIVTRAVVSADLFNALNANPATSETITFSNWQTPLTVLPARLLKMAVQFDF